ncbi:unnamed protein product [Dicrocoelium dendriticum]|nr:unnamed protein product [Dicrocoelium dendriticum]
MDVQSASLPGSRVKFRSTAKAKCCYNPAEQLNYLAQQERVRIDLRRTSLHGKPLLVRQCRTDVRYRRLQAQIYNFLERPKTWKSITYHVFVFACVFICLQLSVLSTLKDYEKMAGITLFYLEMAMLFWFFTEYCIRVWSAGCRSRYQTWRGRLRFMHRPFCLVDATVIIASVVVLSMGTDSQRFAASPLRGLRFFQILRMIRMDRRGGSWKLLASVVWAHRQQNGGMGHSYPQDILATMDKQAAHMLVDW